MKRKKDITPVERKIILAFAANGMRVKKTGAAVFITHAGVIYHLDRIQDKTGLNPRNFYDLVELVAKVKPDKKEV